MIYFRASVSLLNLIVHLLSHNKTPEVPDSLIHILIQKLLMPPSAVWSRQETGENRDITHTDW